MYQSTTKFKVRERLLDCPDYVQQGFPPNPKCKNLSFATMRFTAERQQSCSADLHNTGPCACTLLCKSSVASAPETACRGGPSHWPVQGTLAVDCTAAFGIEAGRNLSYAFIGGY